MERLTLPWRFAVLIVLCWEVGVYAAVDVQGRALLRFKEKLADPFGFLADWNGEGVPDPCSWFGVGCDDGRVVSLKLKNMRLHGSIAPELGKLAHLKYLNLNSNFFSGIIPREIGGLRELEVLDLGHNNLSGVLPPELEGMLSLEILVLEGNCLSATIPSNLNRPFIIFETQTHSRKHCSQKLVTRHYAGSGFARKLLQDQNNQDDSGKSPMGSLSPSPLPSLSPSPSAFPPSISAPASSSNFLSPTASHNPSNFLPSSQPYSETESPTGAPDQGKKKTSSRPLYISIFSGLSFLFVLAALLYFLCFRVNKVVTVGPLATGLSGQLQKAFVTGVPSLKRSEIETACEGFSNIIGTLPNCTLYKGTLSSGVEIAVASTLIKSSKNWSKQCESQFRKKISALSKINHKNFVNLLGYCEEKRPFTRMMIFEYAPNGTLYEHLHVKEAEHLNWTARMRIAMGVAYCLDRMEQLEPNFASTTANLDSSSVCLTEDYAAKVSDMRLWDLPMPPEPKNTAAYSFGLLLIEILSSRVPASSNASLEIWASRFLDGEAPVREMMDPTLASFREEDAVALCQLIRSCVNPDLRSRPAMSKVVSRLKDITLMTPNQASPMASPLWWAELEILV